MASSSNKGNQRDENSARKKRLIWIDCEMTGLEPDAHLLEIACLITEGDRDLTLVAEGPDLIIHQPDSILENMHEWCVKQHGLSGLTKAVRESKLEVAEAEQLVLSFVKEHTPAGVCPVAGNSVRVDVTLLENCMPRLMQHCHYRVVDVSTIKELCRRWYPEKFKGAPAKKVMHRALEDIKESVAELRYYQRNIFIP